MSNLIHQGFKCPVTVVYKKENGDPGEVEGAPIWTMVPPETSVLTVAADGLSGTVTWAGSGAGAILTIKADGDLSSGVFPIIITETFDFALPLGATAGVDTVGAEVPVA
jgi:hypothetical protein